MERFSPKTVAPPLSKYSHAAIIPAGARTLHMSGQVGIGPDGILAKGAEAQLEQVWRNVMAILKAADMGPHDIVKLTLYLLPGVDLTISRKIRDKYLEGSEPASTLVYVAGLASPDYLCEMEVIAAKGA